MATITNSISRREFLDIYVACSAPTPKSRMDNIFAALVERLGLTDLKDEQYEELSKSIKSTTKAVRILWIGGHRKRDKVTNSKWFKGKDIVLFKVPESDERDPPLAVDDMTEVEILQRSVEILKSHGVFGAARMVHNALERILPRIN